MSDSQEEVPVSQADARAVTVAAVEEETAASNSPSAGGVDPPSIQPYALPNLDVPMSGTVRTESIDLLRDVDLHVKIELGRTHMLVEDVLRLSAGSVVELDKLAGDPVDVLVNERLVARGEVLVLNDSFCVRINEIVAPVEEHV